MSFLIPSLYIIVGLVILVWSADQFVKGAAATAQNFGLSPLIIGLTIVSLGTSAPEMFVAAMASLDGKPATAMGNAIGSNITNIALILGVTALIQPVIVKSHIISRELPLLTVISLGVFFILYDGDLSRLDGFLLVAGLLAFMFWLVKQSRNQSNDEITPEVESELPEHMSTARAFFWLILGLMFLVISSNLLVHGASDIARLFGISDLIIGLTIVAIGTSLPELAASITAVLKKHNDIAIGNVIGSNIFNLLAVLAIPGLLAPSEIPADVISRDMPIMLLLTLSLFVLGYKFKNHQGKINRIGGSVLLAAFFAYQIMLFNAI